MTTKDNNDGLNERRRSRMQRKKVVVGVKTIAAMDARGVLLVNTDNGKDKPSSGSGMVMRATDHNMQVGVAQFIKGAIPTGEERSLRYFLEQCSFYVVDEGYTWETQNRMRDVEKAQAIWACTRESLSDSTVGLVLLDELNIVLKYRYPDMQTVLADLRAWPPAQYVVIIGCGAPPELIEVVDIVTDMTLAGHVFSQGIQAQPGVEL